ncbi:hypothetical protein ACVWZD_006106 [Streptomyces sp. TE3672]
MGRSPPGSSGSWKEYRPSTLLWWCTERGQPGDVLVTDLEAVLADLSDGGVRVPGVEEDQGIEDEAEGTDLVLHTVLAAVVELPRPAVEDLPRERVAALPEPGLHLDLAAVVGLVGQAQDVQRLRGLPIAAGRVVAVWKTKSSSSRSSGRGRSPAQQGSRQASPVLLNLWTTSRTVSS